MGVPVALQVFLTTSLISRSSGLAIYTRHGFPDHCKALPPAPPHSGLRRLLLQIFISIMSSTILHGCYVCWIASFRYNLLQPNPSAGRRSKI